MVLLGAAVAIEPLAGLAQPKPTHLIGYLNGTTEHANAPLLAAFRKGLADTGYIEGQNLTIEYRWAEFHYDRLPALAADLVGRKVALIAACGGVGKSLVAKHATGTIPIVFATGADPVANGLVASLARPGGNITGVTLLNVLLMQKRFDLISQLVPEGRLVALLANPTNPAGRSLVESAREAARGKGMQLQVLQASGDAEINAAFTRLAESHASALIFADPLFDSRSAQLAALAVQYKVPTIGIWRKYAADGGLVSYGPKPAIAYHQVGLYAGKILSGARPGDLPVQQSIDFELVINLETAKAIGLAIPQSILVRADEIIE